jgi:hypothetical protein
MKKDFSHRKSGKGVKGFDWPGLAGHRNSFTALPALPV